MTAIKVIGPGAPEPDIPIRDLTRLDMQPGEVLLVRVPDDDWSPKNAQELADYFGAWEIDALITPASFDVCAIRTDVTQQEVNDAAAATPR